MSYKRSLIGLMIAVCAVTLVSVAVGNNLQVSNVGFYDLDAANSNAWVEFDLSWDNSWRISGTLTNWDAAWVFIKYEDAGDINHHAYLSTNASDHTAASGCTVDVGLSTNTSGDHIGMGVFICRDSEGTGSNDFTKVRLCWDYSETGLDLQPGTSVDISVHAIEMVYVSEGSFELGSGGNETGHFYEYPTLTDTYTVSSEDAITTSTSSGDLWGSHGMTGTYAVSPADPDDIPAAFPKGYNAFYCMKYEISQGQYMDFLNQLTRAQQNKRTGSQAANNFAMSANPGLLFRQAIRNPSSIPSGRITFGCDANGNGTLNEADDGQERACNYLAWGDGAAYADWAGLRPMTELEFEKACRGTKAPISLEHVWGSINRYGSAYGLSHDGQPDAVITNAGIGTGNASYNVTVSIPGTFVGPFRCGIFAASISGPTREEAGATYYGVMEMGGSLLERLVTVGNGAGRSFLGTHGDGILADDGNVDGNSDWPSSTTALGSGYRGGNFALSAIYARTSDRTYAVQTTASRHAYYGWRGVRSAP